MPDFIDLTGQKFGRLTVIGRATDKIGPKGYHETYWNCKCDCGNVCTRSSRGLRNGKSLSCGCIRSEKTQTRLLGKRFGHLTVTAFDHQTSGTAHAVYWKCHCDCGNDTVVDGHSLTNGHTTTCGKCKAWLNERDLYWKDRLYTVYASMVARCTNPKHRSYKNYGGRGISICDRWIDNYPAFKDWAYSSGYDETAPRGECTLDRIDNNGNYCPENCRWVDMKTQSRNKRNTRSATLNGDTKCIMAWCDDLNLPVGAVNDRLYNGWDSNKALSVPFRDLKKKYYIGDIGFSIKEWSEKTGLSEAAIHNRLRNGMTLEEALNTPPRYKNGTRGRKFTSASEIVRGLNKTERSETAQLADLLD